MAEGVAGDAFADGGAASGAGDGALECGLVVVVTAALAGLGMGVLARRGEDPLPGPFAGGGWEFVLDGGGELDPAGAVGEIALMLFLDSVEVCAQGLDQYFGEDGGSIDVALAAADEDGAAIEVDVFDAQAKAFEEAKARTIKQGRHETGWAIELFEQGVNFVAAQDYGQVSRLLCTR